MSLVYFQVKRIGDNDPVKFAKRQRKILQVKEMEMVLHPREEIVARIERLRKGMGDLTGVLLFEAVDLSYFSGTAQEGLIYLPKDGLPTVMIRKSLDRAREESPWEVRPIGSLRNLKEILGIPSGAVIGMELDVMPYNHYHRVSRSLGDSSFVDISPTIKRIRSVKSDLEINLIRMAAKMVDAGLASVPDHLREGMREIELAAQVEATMRGLGHQGLVRFRRWNHVLPMGHLMSGPDSAYPSFVSSPTGGRGVSPSHPQGPGFRKIRRGEPVLVDYAGVYNGYIADETRIFSIGSLPEKLEDAHIAAWDIEEAVAKEIRPGRLGRDLFQLSEDMGASLGYQDYLGGPPGSKCGFVGHGVGLEIDDYPVLGPGDHILEASMTLALEPKMIFPGLGVVGVEDTYLIRKQGAEMLTGYPKEICRI